MARNIFRRCKPAYTLEVSDLRLFYYVIQVDLKGKNDFKFLAVAGFVCNTCPATAAVLTEQTKHTP